MNTTPGPRSGLEQPAVPTLDQAHYAQSLEIGLAVLRSFTPEQPLRRLVDIADGLGLGRSTIHRYASTLVRLGFLGQDTKRRYCLRLGVTGLGMSAASSTGLGEHARDLLEELRWQSSYTVGLAVLEDPDIVYIDRVGGQRRGQNLIDLGLEAGSRLPVYSTALGKVLLAYLPGEEQRELIGELTLKRQAPNTIRSKRVLYDELSRVYEDGFATSEDETTAGLLSIAAPVCDMSGDVVAAIGIEAHTSMIALEDMVEHLVPHLLATANRLSARLGYRRQDELAAFTTRTAR
jgi:IclR family pca regulon transcriptional regulator